jgi:nucleotide-binding universal stress UspA family protein
VDDSKASRNATAFATALSDRLGLRLALVHAIRAVWCGPYAAQVAQLEVERAGRLLAEISPEPHETVPFSPHLVFGNATAAIASVAAKQFAVLIAVGSSRGDPIKRLFFWGRDSHVDRQLPVSGGCRA